MENFQDFDSFCFSFVATVIVVVRFTFVKDSVIEFVFRTGGSDSKS